MKHNTLNKRLIPPQSFVSYSVTLCTTDRNWYRILYQNAKNTQVIPGGWVSTNLLEVKLKSFFFSPLHFFSGQFSCFKSFFDSHLPTVKLHRSQPKYFISEQRTRLFVCKFRCVSLWIMQILWRSVWWFYFWRISAIISKEVRIVIKPDNVVTQFQRIFYQL